VRRRLYPAQMHAASGSFLANACRQRARTSTRPRTA
jgi:hypothetical protein